MTNFDKLISSGAADATAVDNRGLKVMVVDKHQQILGHVVDVIDAQFGNGYAKKHPELVGALFQGEAIALFQAEAISDAADEIARAIVKGFSCDTQRTDHPLMADSGISTALESIAHAVTVLANEVG